MKPKARAKRARERSEQHTTRSVFVSEWTHPKALSVFNPECMIAWSTMGPTSKQNEWTMEFWTPWKDTSGPTGWKGRERIYTPEQIPLDPHALQIFVQLKRIYANNQWKGRRGEGQAEAENFAKHQWRGGGQKQSSWNESIIYSIHLKGKVMKKICGNCAVESRRHF